MRKKVTIVGAGNVGATTAQLVAERGLADIVLIDIAEGIPQGKALDIQEACPLWGSSSRVTGSNGYIESVNSDIVVITAGFARKPDMSRDDLLQANARVVREIAENIVSSPQAIVIVVTNPMDVMAYLTLKVSGFSHQKVVGMGGVLDTTRLRAFIAIERNVSPEDVHAIVLGGHGDQMVPLPRLTTVNGVPLTELLPGDKIDRLIDRTRDAGAEIVGMLKTGSAFYAPAASTVEMIEAIINDDGRVLPCSAYLDGQYGIKDVYMGVPVRLGSRGVEEIIELQLTPEEKEAFNKSADSVKSLIQELKL
ncbi:MAG: malate dehydrogenase [Nitrospirae bacterium]|nr:malate dehydrogenase [Nitrospirota bacterium]